MKVGPCGFHKGQCVEHRDLLVEVLPRPGRYPADAADGMLSAARPSPGTMNEMRAVNDDGTVDGNEVRSNISPRPTQPGARRERVAMRFCAKVFGAAVVLGVTTAVVQGTASANDIVVPTPGGPPPVSEQIVDGPINLDELAVAVRPDGGTREGVTIDFDRRSRTESGAKPAPASQFVFLFDKSVRFSPELFPTCAKADFVAHGPEGCPDGSRVGTGTSNPYPEGSAEVAVYNTVYADGQRGVLITIPATRAVFENTFERVVEPYGADYYWGSDELLPSPLPALERGSAVRFRVSFGASRTDATGTHSFVESGAAPGEPMKFGLWSRFVTDQVAIPTAIAQRP